MPVTKIVDRALEINIPNGSKLQKALNAYDTNGDGTFSIDDNISLSSLHETVAGAFQKYAGFSEAQGAGMQRFFDLYNDMKLAAEVTKDWRANNQATWGKELEVTADYWEKSVLPHITGEGVLAPKLGVRNPLDENIPLVSSLLFVFVNLSNPFQGVTTKIPTINHCDGTSGLEYTPSHFPPFLREKMAQIQIWHDEISRNMRGFREIECEGEECFGSPFDEYRWRRPTLKEGEKTQWSRGALCAGKL